MFEIVMLFAFLYAVICPLLSAKPSSKRLPGKKTGPRNHGTKDSSLMQEAARRAATQNQGKPTGRCLRHAHAA